jgi:NitT/TauT family transport system substrate-binding protein
MRHSPSRRLSRRALLQAGAAISAASLLPGRSARADTPIPLSVRLDWTPWGSQAGIHLAQSKGWFHDAGLDVTIADGNGSTQTVQIVGGGSDVDIGFAALSSMMIARDKGLTVKAIASYARRSDIGLMVPLDSGITKVADLKGKRLAHTASSLETPFLDLFLKSGGLVRGDVTLVNLDGAAKLAAYLTGKVDCAFSSIPFFVPAVKAERPSRGLLFADAGLYLPSYGLLARDETIASKKDALTRFVSITDAAWAYIAAGHQDEGVDAIQAARPNAKLSRVVMRSQVDDFLTFFPTPASAGLPVGQMAHADWVQAIDTLVAGKLIQPGQDPDSYFTNTMFDPALYHRIAGS